MLEHRNTNEENFKNLKAITNNEDINKAYSILKERLILTYNYKPINSDATIEENGITDGSIFYN